MRVLKLIQWIPLALVILAPSVLEAQFNYDFGATVNRTRYQCPVVAFHQIDNQTSYSVTVTVADMVFDETLLYSAARTNDRNWSFTVNNSGDAGFFHTAERNNTHTMPYGSVQQNIG